MRGQVAFIAIIAGLAADNTADTILVRAVVSMSACFFLGSLLGLAAEAAIRESLRPRADITVAQNPEPNPIETPPDGQKI